MTKMWCIAQNRLVKEEEAGRSKEGHRMKENSYCGLETGSAKRKGVT